MLNTILLFHPLGDPDVLSTVVSTNAAWNAMSNNILEKERQDSRCSVIVIGADASNKAGVAVNKSVDNDMPPSQACSGSGSACAKQTEF